DHIENAAHDAFADGHGDGGAGIGGFVAALHSLGRAHANAADPFVAEVLLDFERLAGAPAAWHVIFDRERVINRRERFRELDVHDGTDDLNDFAFVHFYKSVVNPSPWR